MVHNQQLFIFSVYIYSTVHQPVSRKFGGVSNVIMYFGGEEMGERGEDNANNHHNNHLLNKVLQTAGSPQQAYFSN